MANTTKKIPHVKYPHIINHTVKSHLRKISNLSTPSTVEEKIDGCNFYIVTNGVDVSFGRKNSLISHSEIGKLVGANTLTDEIEGLLENIVNLHRELRLLNLVNDMERMYLYGELIPVSKRIIYIPVCVSPQQAKFIAFDLRIRGESIHKDIWGEVAISQGIIVNPILFRGIFEECLEFDVDTRTSIVPKLVGVDDDSLLSVPIEGIVIYCSGILTKKKAKEYREIEKSLHKKPPLGENPIHILAMNMMCANRLENILSRIDDGSVDNNPDRLANLVAKDAINELRDDEHGGIHTLSNSQISKLQRKLTGSFRDFVEVYMAQR